MIKLDRTDARILLALCATPRATGVQLATLLNLARNTVQSRVSRWETDKVLLPIDRCVSARDLGYPLQAFVTAVVDQRRLEQAIAELHLIPEVVEAVGMSGDADLLIKVVACDTDDLYRVAGAILAVPGVERTAISVIMREAIPYRMAPLLERLRDSASS
ncbi:Lrp/AsnC family transcriptional regulator [Rhodococcus pseudokoreensis]|uniref:Lrp/AsnC family transcriptional regulator n=1 Tax=Rhodococcus pseudokoreensis TaxID=2811421 RepID=A0A974ZYY6_9NOCA|nr:Lrp/AsnC family transcriptional regulator [Rhodococcus pseudokoreensis]QSE95470.1 Lrp/AsnC family transcriptional regulator [Rhodococcus pseudokoreensis]